MSGQQHVEFHRKMQMRRHLLRRWSVPGPAYVPFIGDGDLATKLYADRIILGADLDGDRVETALARFDEQGIEGNVVCADCDHWPGPPGSWTVPFAIGDFDAYAEPYSAFRAFWGYANKTDRLILFFTDGQRQSVKRAGSWVGPDGRHFSAVDLETRQALFHRYFSETILPWFTDYVAPWRVVDRFRYLRGWMLYWGAVIERG